MRRRGFVRGRDAHQAFNLEPELAAAASDEGVSVARRGAGLLRLLAGVDLDIEAGAAAAALRLTRETSFAR